MKRPQNDNRPYTILLVGDSLKRLRSAWAIADPSPSNSAAATPDRSGGKAASNVRRPQPRTAASQPTDVSAHPSASRTTPADVLWMLNSAVMRSSG